MDYTKFFQTKTRPAQMGPQSQFVCLIDDCPDKIRDLIWNIHFDHFDHFDACMPNDWIYQTIFEAFEALAEDDMDNVNIEVDAYYSDLTKWFSNPFAPGYCNEILETGSEFTNIYTVLEMAQCDAKYHIYHAVNDFLQAQEEQEQPENGEQHD